MEFHKRCEISYSYFEHEKKESQIPLSPLIFVEQEIFHTEGNLGKSIAPLDSYRNFHIETPYLDCECPPLVHLEFFSPTC